MPNDVMQLTSNTLSLGNRRTLLRNRPLDVGDRQVGDVIDTDAK